MVPETSIGVDYHKDMLQVCMMDASGEKGESRRIANDVEELIRIVGRNRTSVTVASEACNGSAAFLDQLHQRTGWKVKLCHPGYAQRMRNNPDKSDRSDSELIADLTRIGYLPEVWLAPQELRDLRSLVRYRASQMEQARATKLRIRALLRNYRIWLPERMSLWTKVGKSWLGTDVGLPSHSAWIMSRYVRELCRLQQEIKETTQRIAAYVKQDTFCQKLIAEPGIGIITAAVMRAEIGTFTRFKNGKQLAKYCGVSPCNRSTGGVSNDSGIIRAGNKVLKACIAQGVWTLIRYNQSWKTFAAALLVKGKPKSVVACAVANRWIRKLFHSVKEL